MHRSTDPDASATALGRARVGVIALLAIVALAGAYTAFWFVAAARAPAGLDRWAQSLRAHDLDLSWRAVNVGGFPLAFRLELRDALLRDVAPTRPGEVRVPLLTASAVPWHPHVWRLAAPQGLTAATEPGKEAPNGKLTVRSAEGAIVVSNLTAGSEGGATLWFGVAGPAAEVQGANIAARQAYFWLILPPHPPQSHTDPAAAFAVDAWDLALPFAPPPPLQNPIGEVGFGVTILGQIPRDASPREAATAWRDAGGTIELDHFDLRWGALAIRGSGTAALDPDLQPSGAFSGAVAGYPQLLSALVATGRIRRGDAGIAEMALAFLSRTGPDGRPEIRTSLTIQDGRVYLGPARLGPAPHIDW